MSKSGSGSLARQSGTGTRAGHRPLSKPSLTPQQYSSQEHVDVDSIQSALKSYSHTDRKNANTAYSMGFNDQAQELIEKIAKGNYGVATNIAKQAVNQSGWQTYGVTLSTNQAAVLAQAAFDNQLVSGSNYKGKTIFNYDAREAAKLAATQAANKQAAKQAAYNATYQKSSTKIAVGSVVYDDKGNKAVIDKVITASTGYVLVKYANGITKKQMAFNLTGEDGNPLKKTKFK